MKVSVRVNKYRRGYTLIETLIAIGVGGLFLAMFASISVSGGRSLALLTNYLDVHAQSRIAADVLSRDIRNAVRLTEFSSDRVAFDTTNDVSKTSGHLVLQYRPTQKELVSIVDSNAPQVIISHCDSLKFSIFQRNPVNGTYDQYPAGSIDTCKLVQIDWVSAQHIAGLKSSETVQSAKIVIRNAKRTTY